MPLEPLGRKLQQTRLAKKISLEEASRVTKIRPARIQEIEAEDFSGFPSLAYAKGFLLIYGKFLDVDVTPYLDAFETSSDVSVNGYSYLQDAPENLPPPVIRRQRTTRPGLLPLIIAIAVLVVGLYLVKLLVNIQRIAPPREPAPMSATTGSSTPTPTATAPERLAAPRAIPVESPAAAEPVASAAPTVAAAEPSASQPQVRRAEPVGPGATAAAPPSTLPPGINRVQVLPIRKTHVTVTVNRAATPVFDGWLQPSDPPLTFSAQHVTVQVLERGAVEVTKNGSPVSAGDADVDVE